MKPLLYGIVQLFHLLVMASVVLDKHSHTWSALPQARRVSAIRNVTGPDRMTTAARAQEGRSRVLPTSQWHFFCRKDFGMLHYLLRENKNIALTISLPKFKEYVLPTF